MIHFAFFPLVICQVYRQPWATKHPQKCTQGVPKLVPDFGAQGAEIHLICFKSKNPVNFLPHTTQNLSAAVSRSEPSPLAASSVDFRGLFCRKENDNKPRCANLETRRHSGRSLGAVPMALGPWQGFSCHRVGQLGQTSEAIG